MRPVLLYVPETWPLCTNGGVRSGLWICETRPNVWWNVPQLFLWIHETTFADPVVGRVLRYTFKSHRNVKHSWLTPTSLLNLSLSFLFILNLCPAIVENCHCLHHLSSCNILSGNYFLLLPHSSCLPCHACYQNSRAQIHIHYLHCKLHFCP